MKNNSNTDNARLLLCSPTEANCSVLVTILAASGVKTVTYTDVGKLVQHLESGADAALVTEEALTDRALKLLHTAFASLPEWSNFPLIIVSRSRGNPTYIWNLIEKIGYSAQIQILERPLYTAELLSAVRVAIQSRRRQLQIRDELTLRHTIEERLKKESRKKNEFLAILGHELRNPLAALSTALELVRKNPDTDRLTWCEQVVGKQVRQLQRLVNDLIDISRITHGQIELQYSAVEIGGQMAEAAEATTPLFTDNKQQLWISIPEQPLYILADPVRLQQVLINLLKNAAFYTPEGGEIRFSATREDGYSVVSIRDTGVGLTPEQSNMIFEPFSEIRPRLNNREPGLGLGLSVVKQITELHGGTVEAESEGPGKGSTFIVRIPLTETSLETGKAGPERLSMEQRAAEEKSRDSTPRTILIAEDNRDFAELLLETLKEDGHIVTITENGKDAVTFSCRDNPDFVIIDIGLPDMDGYRVGEAIRCGQGEQRSTLIALSGYSQNPEKAPGLFDHYILKGSDIGNLFRIIETG